MRIDTIREGVCPECAVALERQEDHGRCPQCGGRWSIAGDEVFVHIVCDVPAVYK